MGKVESSDIMSRLQRVFSPKSKKGKLVVEIQNSQGKVLYEEVVCDEKYSLGNIDDNEKLFTAKDLEDEELKITLYFKDVIKNLNKSSAKEMEVIVNQLDDVKTNLSESDAVIRNNKNKLNELKEHITGLEEGRDVDEVTIADLKDELIQLKLAYAKTGLFNTLQSLLSTLTTSCTLALSSAYQAKDHSLAENGEKLVNLLPDELQLVVKIQYENIRDIPKAGNTFLTNMLPSQLGIILDNIPIVRNLSMAGQTKQDKPRSRQEDTQTAYNSIRYWKKRDQETKLFKSLK